MPNLSDFDANLKKALDFKSNQPFITINKLAEYMSANSTRRRQIVKSLKEDKDFWKVRYSTIRPIIPKYFNSNYDSKILEKVITNLEKKLNMLSHTSKWDKDDISNTILAIKSLIDAELPDITDYKIIEHDKIDYIILSDVKVTIKPELYFENIHSGKIGGLKIHIAKTEQNRLNLTGMQYAATIIKYGFIQYGYNSNKIDNNACISLDIFEQNYAVSPVAYKRSVDALTAACEEISLWWNNV